MPRPTQTSKIGDAIGAESTAADRLAAVAGVENKSRQQHAKLGNCDVFDKQRTSIFNVG